MFFFRIDVSIFRNKHHQNYWKSTIEIYRIFKYIKNWYYSYSNTPFIGSTISISCLNCLDSFKGNYLILRFNCDCSCLISKLSLMTSLNLFTSKANILKWSKFIEQLHLSRLSDTIDYLTLLRRFLVKLEIPVCSAVPVKKWWYIL